MLKFILVVLGVWWIALPAASQDLLANGNFDTDTASWTLSFGIDPARVRWLADDVAGSLQSGSVELTNVGPGNGGFKRTLEQCVPVNADERYLLTGWGKVPADQPGNGGMFLVALPYQFEGCTGPPSGSFNSSSAGPNDTWEVMTDSFETFSSTQSLLIAAAIGKEQGFDEDVTGQIDAVSLVTDAILRSGFE